MNGSIKRMAYGGNDGGTSSAIYRMERNTPYMRAGQLVPSYPQFKALQTYTPAPGIQERIDPSGNVTNKNIQAKTLNVSTAFRVGMSYTRITWPIPVLPNPTTGGS